MARLISTYRGNFSNAGIDAPIDNWYALYVSIICELEPEEAFHLYQTGKKPYRHWSENEDLILINGRKNKITFVKIAEALGRNYRSVQSRWKWLNDHNRVY